MVIIYRILRKLLFFLSVFLFSSCLFVISSSYTVAEVRSNAALGITDSESALISLPSNINGGKIEKAPNSDLKHHFPIPGRIQVSIKNNMNKRIWVTCEISRYKHDMLLEVAEPCSGIEIHPGCSATMDFLAFADHQAKVGTKIFDLTFKAEWNGGSAIIESQMNIEVIEPLKNNYPMDMEPSAAEFVGIQSLMEAQAMEEEQNYYYEDTLEAESQTWMDILKQQHTMVESKQINKTDEIGTEDEQNRTNNNQDESDRENYEKNIAELFQRSIRLLTDIENILNGFNSNMSQFNNYNENIKYNRGASIDSMPAELYQEYIRQYFELHALVDKLSGIAKGEYIIDAYGIADISQQLQNCGINNQVLYQSYIESVYR